MGSAQGPVTPELEQARTAPEFGAHTPLSEKLLAVAIRAQNFTGSTGVAIALTEGQEMVCRANWGTSAPEVGAKLSIENSFTGLCVRTGEPVRCDDAQSDPRVDSEACQALGISAIAAAPVRRGLKVIGVIAAFSDTPKAFSDKHLLILTTLADVIVELLDDPQPVQPLPQMSEATPDLSRAAAVAQAPVGSLVDKVSVTTVVQEPAPTPAPADSLVIHALPLYPPVAAAASSPSGTVSIIPLQPRPEPDASSLSASAATAAPARTLGNVTPYDNAPDWFQVPPDKDEILPAAMNPGVPPQPSKTGLAAGREPARLTLVKQPASAPVPDFTADTFTFAGFEADSSPRRRWVLPAAILAIFAVIAVAGWRLHLARNAGVSEHAPAAPAPEQQATPALQAEQAPEVKAAEPAAPEPRQSPFSPPPIAKVAPQPAKAKPTSEPPADITIKRDPQPVVEASGPVRQPTATGMSRTTQPPEAQAPQLALSAPDLPTALARPTPAAVAAPVSRIVPAQLLQRVEPRYPETARRLKISGRVVVKATVTKAGTVGEVQWVSGSDLFRDSTIAAVKQWRYKPASLNGKPVESELELVLQFNRPVNQ